MVENLLQYQIAITLLPNVGPVLAKNLISYCGGVKEVFNATHSKLVKVPGIGPITAKEILGSEVMKRAEEEVQFVERNNIQPLFYLDEQYPQRLKNCYDNPVLLYYKGEADLNVSRIVSIVGTRNATDYGKSVCEKMIAELAKYDVLIASGLAYGVDICAHKAALENNLKTVAVLGHGLHIIYPSQHKSTAKKITEQGGLLAEYTSNSPFDKENFPKRNRIIAGMADATIVIETKKHGGSVITAEIANDYNKDVYAVPGNINSPFSEGCNYLIRTNKAQLLDSVEDLATDLGWTTQKVDKPVMKEIFIELNEEEKILVDVLKESPQAPIDEITVKVKLSSSQIASNLLNLEFKGLVKSLPGKRYQLIN